MGRYEPPRRHVEPIKKPNPLVRIAAATLACASVFSPADLGRILHQDDRTFPAIHHYVPRPTVGPQAEQAIVHLSLPGPDRTTTFNLYVRPELPKTPSEQLALANHLLEEGYDVRGQDLNDPGCRELLIAFRTDENLEQIMQHLSTHEGTKPTLVWKDGDRDRAIPYHPVSKQEMLDGIKRYVTEIAAKDHAIAQHLESSVRIAYAAAGTESDFNFYRASSQGAIGPMQPMPSSASDIELREKNIDKKKLSEEMLAALKEEYKMKLWDPNVALRAGVVLALEAYKEAHWNVRKTANIYSRGLPNVLSGTPKPWETKVHEERWVAYYRAYPHTPTILEQPVTLASLRHYNGRG